MPNDPKWRTISRVSNQKIGDVIAVYVHMLICASNATERGRTHGWEDEHTASALDLLERFGFVVAVTGHFKTSQAGSNQNQPL